MNKVFSAASFIAIATILLMCSCNDPLQIGTEFVGGEENVDFFTTDTVSLEASTIQLDSAIAYQFQTVNIDIQQLGWVNDPILGGHRSSYITQLVPSSTSRPMGTIDSVRLTIRIDSTRSYGDQMAAFNLSVRKLTDNLNNRSTYYTDENYSTSGSIGSNPAFVRPTTDSISLVERNEDGDLDTVKVASVLSITLDNSFGEELFMIDSTKYLNTDSFLVGGPSIMIQPQSQNNAFLPLKTLITTRDNNYNKLSVFYTFKEGPQQYDYFLGGAAFSAHEHDYSSGTIAGIIDNPSAGTDMLATQAGQGPTIAVKVPHKAALQNLVINEAILEMVVEELSGDDPLLYPLPQQLYTAHIAAEGNIPTDNVILTSALGFSINDFGGQPTLDTSAGVERTVYRFNVSDHLQKMITGEVSEELLIRSPLNASGVRRVVFHGTDRGANSVRLILTYSEL